MYTYFGKETCEVLFFMCENIKECMDPFTALDRS